MPKNSLELHLDDQRMLMQLELNAQRREHYLSAGASTLVVVPLESKTSAYGGLLVNFVRLLGSARCKTGSIVSLIGISGTDVPSTRCTVMKADPKMLQLLTPKRFEPTVSAQYRVDKIYWDQRGGYLLAMQQAQDSPSPLTQLLTSPNPPMIVSALLKFPFVNKHLNCSQQTAVTNSISCYPLAIIHGPPGRFVIVCYRKDNNFLIMS